MATAATSRESSRIDLWFLRRPFFLVASNQPCAVLIGDVSPGPIQHDHHAVAETNQEKQVYEQPCQPGEVSREMQLPKIAHRLSPPDSCKTTLCQFPNFLL